MSMRPSHSGCSLAAFSRISVPHFSARGRGTEAGQLASKEAGVAWIVVPEFLRNFPQSAWAYCFPGTLYLVL